MAALCACRPTSRSGRSRAPTTAPARRSRTAGAEFWSAFFFASTIAIPILFYATHLASIESLMLALGGVFLSITYVGAVACWQARSEADSYTSW